MTATHDYYELSIYSPINEHTYRVTKKVFDSHEKGMRWAIDNYGWTDALYTGEYIERKDVFNNVGFIYLNKDEVEATGAQSISDLQAFIREIKGKQ